VDFEFLVDNEPRSVGVEKRDGRWIFSLDEKTIEADIQPLTPNEISVMIEGTAHRVYFAHDEGQTYFCLHGQVFLVKEPRDESAEFAGAAGGSGADLLLIKAPMPGKVIKIDVKEKDEVRKNQTLAVVEAMKMENEIKSTVDGFVKKIFVSAGDLVDAEKPLIELDNK